MSTELERHLTKKKYREVFGPVVRTLPKKYTVHCFVCDHHLKCPRISNIDKHSAFHQDYLSVTPVDGLSAKKVFQRNELISMYSFLQPIGSLVQCLYCPDKFNITGDATKISDHSSCHRHRVNKKKCLLGGEEEYAFKKRMDTMKRLVELNPKLLAITTEDDDVEGNVLNLLYCIPCRRSFNPKNPDNYEHDVDDHFLSRSHTNCLEFLTEREKHISALEDLTPKSKAHAKKYNLDGTRRLLSPFPIKIHPRIISDEDCDVGLQALMQVNNAAVRSCSTYCKDIIDARIRRPISFTTLWKRAIPKALKDDFVAKNKALDDRDLWIMVDETKNKNTHDSKSVTSILIGSLDESHTSHNYLVETTDKAPNAEEVKNMIDKALLKAFPDGKIPKKKIRVFISDSAQTMKKVGRLMEAEFPNLIAITCVTHGLHLVCDVIRKEFSDVNTFVALMKRVMVNSYANKVAFKKASNLDPTEKAMATNIDELAAKCSHLPAGFLEDPTHPDYDEYLFTDIDALNYALRFGLCCLTDESLTPDGISPDDGRPLPPHPVISRFGTWLRAVCFYFHYWNRSVNFIETLMADPKDKEGKSFIKQLKTLIKNKGQKIKSEIDLIFRKFSLLLVYICELEKDDEDAEVANQTVEKAREYIEAAAADEADKNGPAHKAAAKFKYVFDKNSGLKELLKRVKKDKNEALSFSPVTSMKVERFFSRLRKEMSSDKPYRNSDNYQGVILLKTNLAKRRVGGPQKSAVRRQMNLEFNKHKQKKEKTPYIPNRRKKPFVKNLFNETSDSGQSDGDEFEMEGDSWSISKISVEENSEIGDSRFIHSTIDHFDPESVCSEDDNRHSQTHTPKTNRKRKLEVSLDSGLSSSFNVSRLATTSTPSSSGQSSNRIDLFHTKMKAISPLQKSPSSRYPIEEPIEWNGSTGKQNLENLEHTEEHPASSLVIFDCPDDGLKNNEVKSKKRKRNQTSTSLPVRRSSRKPIPLIRFWEK